MPAKAQTKLSPTAQSASHLIVPHTTTHAARPVPAPGTIIGSHPPKASHIDCHRKIALLKKDLNESEKKHQAQLRETQDKYQQGLKTLENEYKTSLENIQKKHEQTLFELENAEKKYQQTLSKYNTLLVQQQSSEKNADIVTTMKKQIEELQPLLKEHLDQITALKTDLESSYKEMEQKKSDLAKAIDSLSELKSKLETEQGRNATLEKQLHSTQESLAKKEKTIADLKEEKPALPKTPNLLTPNSSYSRWWYALAGLAIVAGAAACATGIGGLILGIGLSCFAITSLVCGLFTLASGIAATKKIYQANTQVHKQSIFSKSQVSPSVVLSQADDRSESGRIVVSSPSGGGEGPSVSP